METILFHLIFTVLFILANVVFAKAILNRVSLVFSAQKAAFNEDFREHKNLALRIKSVIFNVLLQKKNFKESELILILKGVVSSLAYLQKAEICHGNINTQTIFYDNTKDCYKLLDQELINGYLSSFTLASQDKFFSYYLSPEILIALQEKNILLIKNGNKIFKKIFLPP